MALGAIPRDGGIDFRVWAPRPARVEIQLESGEAPGRRPMDRDGEYWAAHVPGGGAGLRYRFIADGLVAPDPCSRSQPDGVHGPSEVVDPALFQWQHDDYRPPDAADLVIYECHVGTFTDEGTFDAAARRLPWLASLGINAIEVMPIASFPGRWNWGYDGASLFAPAAAYGGPEAFRRFVDAAHGRNLAVILDVVYNHFGPAGNYTGVYSDRYFTSRYATPWGDALNLDGPGSSEVRRFFRENLVHWLREYHVDGFRFDATHAIHDASEPRILAELAAAAVACRPDRPPYLIAESNENDVRYLRPRSDGGYGFDAVWADDFHHVVRNLLHTDRDGYLGSYAGTTAELAATIDQGFLFEGQEDPATGAPRGTVARDMAPSRFVFCIQNHDQVGNRAFGLRAGTTTSLADYLAISGLLLLLPHLPLIFQGQEFTATTPFLFFSDHDAELGRLVTEGRRQEFAAFRAFQDPAVRQFIPDPQAESTFRSSKLRWAETESGGGALCLSFYRAALALRRSDPVLAAARRCAGSVSSRAFGTALVATITGSGGVRYLALNLGADAVVPFATRGLKLLISSDDPRFGGDGRLPHVADGALAIPGHTVALLAPLTGGVPGT